MNPIQDLKMTLLDKFGIVDEPKTIDFCREAYKFLIEGDTMILKGVNAVTGEVIVERVPLTPTHSKVVAIDLGLPSGTLWADRNVGASSPEDYGAFFSWGNVEPKYPTRKNMDWGRDDDGFKGVYSFDEEEYQKTEGYKLKGDIDLAHDAARINMGEPWQMPTSEQFQELYDNCTWERKTVNGVNGYLVTSKINGNSIFFACSGYGNGTSWGDRGSSGDYWSASFLSARSAYYLYFISGDVNPQNSYNRFYGFPVRPVQNIVSQK